MEAIRERLEERRMIRKWARQKTCLRGIAAMLICIIGWESLYYLGVLIRGYRSFGGESMLIVALAAYGIYRLYRNINK